jgi:hypothetical protein
MPLEIRVEPTKRLRYAVAHGRLTDRDLLEAWGDALADPAFDPALDSLVDISEAESFEVTPAGAQRLADVMEMCGKEPPPGTRPRVAFVAPTDEAFGVCRIYETYRELRGASAHFFVTRSKAEAQCWLGLPRV